MLSMRGATTTILHTTGKMLRARLDKIRRAEIRHHCLLLTKIYN
jgi:hypothetical protein